MMIRNKLLIAAVAYLSICSTTPVVNLKAQVKNDSPGITQKSLSKTEQEDDIREAVFRYQFEHDGSAVRPKAKVYFLALGPLKRITDPSHDPSNKFMQRFKGHKPSVKKASSAEDWNGEIRDGLIFYIVEIKWINEHEVEVSGGNYEGNMSSSGNKYQVVQENGKWIVKKDMVEWIS